MDTYSGMVSRVHLRFLTDIDDKLPETAHFILGGINGVTKVLVLVRH